MCTVLYTVLYCSRRGCVGLIEIDVTLTDILSDVIGTLNVIIIRISNTQQREPRTREAGSHQRKEASKAASHKIVEGCALRREARVT